MSVQLCRFVSLARTFGQIQCRGRWQIKAPLQTDPDCQNRRKAKCRCFAFGRALPVAASAWPTMLGCTRGYHHGHHQPSAAENIRTYANDNAQCAFSVLFFFGQAKGFFTISEADRPGCCFIRRTPARASIRHYHHNHPRSISQLLVSKYLAGSTTQLMRHCQRQAMPLAARFCTSSSTFTPWQPKAWRCVYLQAARFNLGEHRAVWSWLTTSAIRQVGPVILAFKDPMTSAKTGGVHLVGLM